MYVVKGIGEGGGNVLTKNLRLYFHGNFSFMFFWYNVWLLITTSCHIQKHSHVSAFSRLFWYACGCVLVWIGNKKGKYAAWVSLLTQLVQCASVKRIAKLVQLIRTILAGGLSGYRACVNLWGAWKKYENCILRFVWNLNVPVQIVLSICCDLKGQLCSIEFCLVQKGNNFCVTRMTQNEFQHRTNVSVYKMYNWEKGDKRSWNLCFNIDFIWM